MVSVAARTDRGLMPGTTSTKDSHLSHQNSARATGASTVFSNIQQALGNQAMQRLLSAHVIQAKLAINQPGDEYEQEADRIADLVIQETGTGLAARATDSGQNMIHLRRKCSQCEEEEPHLQMKSVPGVQRCSCSSDSAAHPCEACKSESLQRQENSEDQVRNNVAPPIVHEVLSSSGQSLQPSVRQDMEARFGGHDFSRVQVHTDSRSAESARAVHALAYTVGNHVVFGDGQYAPFSRSGQQLLAHELVHVLQQRGGTERSVQEKLAIGEINDAAESEADSFAAQSRGPAANSPVAVNALHRQPVLRRAYATPQKANEARPATVPVANGEVSVTRSFQECPCRKVDEVRSGIFYNPDLQNLAIAWRRCSGGRTIDVYGQLQSNANAFLQNQAPPQGTVKVGIDINVVGKSVSGRVILEPLATNEDLGTGVGGHAQVVFEGGKWSIFLDSQYIRRLEKLPGGFDPNDLQVTLGGQIGSVKARVVAKELLSTSQTTVHGTVCFGDSTICGFIQVGQGQVTGGIEGKFDQPKVRKETCHQCLCPPPKKKYDCVRYLPEKYEVDTPPLRYYFHYSTTAESEDQSLQTISHQNVDKVAELVGRGYTITSITGYASPENITPGFNKPLSEDRGKKLSEILQQKLGPTASVPKGTGAGELVGQKGLPPVSDLDDVAKAHGFPSAEEITKLLTGPEIARRELVPQFLALFKDPQLKDDDKVRFFGFDPKDPVAPQVIDAVQQFVTSKGSGPDRWNHIFPMLRYASVTLHGTEERAGKVGGKGPTKVITDKDECDGYGKTAEKTKEFGEIDKSALQPSNKPEDSDTDCLIEPREEDKKDCDYSLPKEFRDKPKKSQGTLNAPDFAPNELP